MKHLVVVAVFVLAAQGCKKKQRHSRDCEKSVELTAPWKDLALPIGGAHVCSSTEQQAQLQYLEGDRPGWEQRYEDALVAQGFAKDRCSQLSCTFKRGTEKATVQVFQAERWVNVTVRR